MDHIIQKIRASEDETDPHYAALLGWATGAANADLLVDLVIDLAPWTDKPTNGFYYFVNHSARCPFWLHDVPANDLGLWDTIQGPIEKEQLSE